MGRDYDVCPRAVFVVSIGCFRRLNPAFPITPHLNQYIYLYIIADRVYTLVSAFPQPP